MRILMLTRYDRKGASSRVRSLQYVPFLKKKGWQVKVRPLFSDAYLEALYGKGGRGKIVLLGYLRRLLDLARAKAYDLIWLEKELFPYLPAYAEYFLKVLGFPYVVDYDDALFHRYDNHRWWVVRTVLGRKIDMVMRHATLVIAGNEYLAQRARAARKQGVAVVPTVVDLDRYVKTKSKETHHLTIGWIGSPTTSRYLTQIAPVLTSVAIDQNVRIVAVGAAQDDLKGLPIDVWDWSEATEVESIRSFDIGIMPLPDEPWERGKCGYKLIQYMACCKPVVASPMGVNCEIVEHGVNGFLVSTQEEWIESFRLLKADPKLRRRMGEAGYQKVVKKYSLQVTAPRLAELLEFAPKQFV
jgi:glycosyltransferase involved in cell wall biosynthesis